MGLLTSFCCRGYKSRVFKVGFQRESSAGAGEGGKAGERLTSRAADGTRVAGRPFDNYSGMSSSTFPAKNEGFWF